MFPLLPIDHTVPFELAVVWFFWFLFVGGIMGAIMNALQEVSDRHDAFRRTLFTFIVSFGGLIFARLPQTMLTYGADFREGPAIFYWVPALTVGVLIVSLLKVRKL